MIQNILLLAGHYLIGIIIFLIFVNAMLSWVRPNPDNPLIRLVYGLTEPILAPLRRFAVIGTVDFSAILALLLLRVLVYPVYETLIRAIF